MNSPAVLEQVGDDGGVQVGLNLVNGSSVADVTEWNNLNSK